jgi:hypothetical protein
MSLPLIVISTCFVLAHFALRSQSSRLTQGQSQRSMIKALAAVRIICSAALVVRLVLSLLERTSALPPAARWTAWLMTSVALLLCFVNATAGLWILSPFVGADLGMDVVAAGQRGKIRGYGLARLEVSTLAGWSAHLPYWLVALRPLRTLPRDGPCSVELRMRQEHWSDTEVSLLRQTAIFSPYRDITSKVMVTRHSRLVTIRLGLTSGSAESQVQRQLEQALAELRAQAKRTSPP